MDKSRVDPRSPDSSTSGDVKDLNFKVSEQFHCSYKMTSAAWGMPMKELLDDSYYWWTDEIDLRHGKNAIVLARQPPRGERRKATAFSVLEGSAIAQQAA
jgi:hypothetical protein